jgi:type VI secretion system secreted protein Hcp
MHALKRVVTPVFQTTLLLTLLYSASLSANIFLNIDGAEGESQSADFNGQIDVLDWSWSGDRNGANVDLGEVSVVKYVDSASAKLFEYLVTATYIENIKLVVTRAGEVSTEYLSIELTGARVSSLSTGGSNGEDRLTENVSFSFDEITYKYTQQSEDGSAGEMFTYTHNNPSVDAGTGACVDPDGDGWGWDGVKSCRL